VTLETGGDWIARIDQTTGDVSIVGPTSTFIGLVATATDLYGFAANGTIARLDPATGMVLSSVAGVLAWSGVALAPPPP
jgi:hypothetical protein